MILFELFVHASGAQPLNVVRLTCTRSIHREWIQRKLVLRLVTFCDMPESRLLCLSRRLGFAGATERSVVLRVSPLPQFIASCSRSYSIYLVTGCYDASPFSVLSPFAFLCLPSTSSSRSRSTALHSLEDTVDPSDVVVLRVKDKSRSGAMGA